MTDEQSGRTDVPEGADSADPVAGQEAEVASALPERFRSGQGMVTLGSWIIVGIYLITGLLLNEYWIAWLALIPAIAVVVLGRVNPDSFKSIGTVPTLIKVLGYLIAVVAAIDLIEDIRFASTSFDEVIDVIGSLAFWGAAALCFFGARSIQD